MLLITFGFVTSNHEQAYRRPLKMLNLFKNDGTLLKVFEGYRDLYLYITHEENRKLFKNHPEFSTPAWSFSILSPEQVARLIQALEKDYDMLLLFEAWERKLPMIEIGEGKYQEVTQILVTPDIDVEGFRDGWCLAYCKAHGLYATRTEG
jgi:hypothetical protein